ncbi:MAG: DUF3473 domain-containing protein [Gammaproteobacteria bacterium]|nr:DUF3473 domain-containing protein [Gammaproteobacteria bacterium]
MKISPITANDDKINQVFSKNAMTVDVEDYFHVAALAKSIDRSQWDSCELRVEKNTDKLLELFDAAGIKTTFFILGWVAEKLPNIVEKIFTLGHEVACHGYSHQLVYEQSPEEFKQETIRSKSLLEDIIQHPVAGYRAASYSITRSSYWAMEILINAGFDYDSSIFPVRHDRYGVPDSPLQPYRITTATGQSIIEFPLSTLKLFNYSLPVAGGGYFRLYPYWLTKLAFSRLSRLGRPGIFYLHPWEVDPEQPRYKASMLSTFRHYNNLDKCEARLSRLLKDFKFTTVQNTLNGLSLEEKSINGLLI